MIWHPSTISNQPTSKENGRDGIPSHSTDFIDSNQNMRKIPPVAAEMTEEAGHARLRTAPGSKKGMFESTRRAVTSLEAAEASREGELGVQTFVQRMQNSEQGLTVSHPARSGQGRREGGGGGGFLSDSDMSDADSDGGGGWGGEDSPLSSNQGSAGGFADDALVWQLEHIRHFSIELSALAVSLNEVCTKETCPQMKATDEWMYLCAAHRQPQECCAMDYIMHTLDGTCSLLTSTKWFPSRTEVPQMSTKYFQSITRRLYRILSHTFFHHREMFDESEAKTHLCQRFVAFARAYDLIPPKLLIVPESGYSSFK